MLLQRIIVDGDSMRPTLEPGDRVLCVRIGRRRGVRRGDVVALRDPREPGRVIVKRVVTVDPLTVEGDNAAASTDSRTFGTVERSAVVGRAVYRYWPEDRRGRLGA